ncbi:hypothetical protein F2Q69_00042817 [Brassica cretica]|uniref:Uncharacterized protein n=1 Tax=Brassica cretica TaxID=69181 RepID=A0A8S9NMA7_BRACR|nr:hypothetical protein F2Q69_00042817 [Brassica cretica]
MGVASKGPRIVLRELRRGCTVSGQEVGPRPWARKRSSKKKTSSSGNPYTNEEIVPKEEFEVEQEEKEAYWDALCGLITPPLEVFYPTRPAMQLDLTLPCRTSPAYLKTLQEFYRVPSGVVFRVPVHGESAKEPPEGFFTCYKAFLTRCRMWFPIPEAIVRALVDAECGRSLFECAMALRAVGASVGSTTVSGVGLSAGKAMDSGTMSLSRVVSWSGDSGSLFMELSGAF